MIGRVRKWVAAHPDSDVVFIFEKGDRYQHELIDRLRKEEHGLSVEPMFVAKAWEEHGCKYECIPLQASDLLAYETHKMFVDLIDKDKTKAREPLFQITPREPTAHHRVLGGRFIEAVVRTFKVPRRSERGM